MQNIIFKKKTDPKNQIILSLFCLPTDPMVLLVDQKINLVSPKKVSKLTGHYLKVFSTTKTYTA